MRLLAGLVALVFLAGCADLRYLIGPLKPQPVQEERR